MNYKPILKIFPCICIVLFGSVTMLYADSAGHIPDKDLHPIETKAEITMADHDIGNVRFSVSDGGRFGWDNLDQTAGSGFVFPILDHDQLFEGALVAGYDSVHVSHAARITPAGPVAFDWQPVPGGEITITTPGTISDQDGFSIYSDIGAPFPMGLEVVQRSYAWGSPPYDDFVIIELTFRNTGILATDYIEDFYAGLFMDWDIQPFSGTARNYAEVDPANDVGYMWNEISNKHGGVSVITSPGLVSFDIINNQDGSYQFSRGEFWNSLSGGIVDPYGANEDFSVIVSTGPFDIPAGDSIVVAFAVIGGEDLEDFLANVSAAREIYPGPPQTVSLTVTPDGSSFPRGGDLGFQLTATNLTDEFLRLEGWCDLTFPNGRHISPAGGPIPIVLGPGYTLNMHISQGIPSDTPLGGPYTYCVRAGNFPNPVVDMDCFEFDIVLPTE